jgi:hypothetical protein
MKSGAPQKIMLDKLSKDKKVNLAQGNEVCMICYDTIEAHSPYASCRLAEEHNICSPCFVVYVRHCVDHYMEDSTLPISCSLPECNFLFPEANIEALLSLSNASAVFIKYQSISYLAGLVDDRTLVPLTCPTCKKYTELLPRGYQDLAVQVREKLKAVSSSTPLERQDEEKQDVWDCFTCSFCNSSSRSQCVICYRARPLLPLFFNSHQAKAQRTIEPAGQASTVDMEVTALIMVDGKILGKGKVLY